MEEEEESLFLKEKELGEPERIEEYLFIFEEWVKEELVRVIDTPLKHIIRGNPLEEFLPRYFSTNDFLAEIFSHDLEDEEERALMEGRKESLFTHAKRITKVHGNFTKKSESNFFEQEEET